MTGFMGVGKSTVARCLSYILKTEKIDLDWFIEEKEGRTIPAIIREDGEQQFRDLETKHLQTILSETDSKIIALGGGAWTTEKNREIIKNHKCLTIWLESTFDHCWRNISVSKHDRPLVKDRNTVKKILADGASGHPSDRCSASVSWRCLITVKTRRDRRCRCPADPRR